MSSSGDSSPDWLRSFQVPSHSPVTLSSDSESLHDGGSFSNEDKIDDEGSSPKSPELSKFNKTKSTAVDGSPVKYSSRRKKLDQQKEKDGKEEKKTMDESNSNKQVEHKESIRSIWTLSSDSESCGDLCPIVEDDVDQVETSQQQKSQSPGEERVLDHDGKSPSKKASQEKSLQKQKDLKGSTPVKGKKAKGSTKGKVSGKGTGGDGDAIIEVEETFEKPVGPNVSSSSMLPLMLSEKVHRTKALIECQGDSIDLSGDMGAVGRIIISDSPSGDQEMCLDLKGTIYKTSIVPCRTFCVVSFGQSEAKIEAVMNDFIQLRPHSNVYEAETMVEGTLDGFSFDSDEEAGKTHKATHQTDQNEHAEEQTHGKSKGKAGKTTGAEKKRGRSTGKSQPKVVKKKAQGTKKAKTKK